MPSHWVKLQAAKNYEDHVKRVKSMKSSIDNKKPREMPLSMRNEIERRRVQAAIEKDNRLLLDRLAVAMSVKNIDNEQHITPFVSYGVSHRKKELSGIMNDNKILLSRIQNCVPAYNHMLWEKEAENRVNYLKNMTEFPEYFVPPGQPKKSFVNKVPFNNRLMAIDPEEFKPKPPPEMGMSGSLRKSRPMSTNSNSLPRLNESGNSPV